MNFLFSLWQFPYFKWHVLFTILPIILMWVFFWKYLIRYKKTFLLGIFFSAICGTLADFVAVNFFHLWSFDQPHHFGPIVYGLPLGEYSFMIIFPVFMISWILLLRKFLYKKK